MPMDLDLSQYKATGLSADDLLWDSDDEVIKSDSLKKYGTIENKAIVDNIMKMGFSQNAARYTKKMLPFFFLSTFCIFVSF
jgi:hypothetical protein